jgi:hypothetical protein
MEKIIYQKRRVGLGFNCVIELNQKMLILKRFVAKKIVYMMMTTEFFIKILL